MNRLTSVIRKELRAWFLSPIALLFIGSFLLVALFSFFLGGGIFCQECRGHPAAL